MQSSLCLPRSVVELTDLSGAEFLLHEGYSGLGIRGRRVVIISLQSIHPHFENVKIQILKTAGQPKVHNQSVSCNISVASAHGVALVSNSCQMSAAPLSVQRFELIGNYVDEYSHTPSY